MQSPFELKGYWWLPSLEENKLPGTLTFSQEEGAILELVGVYEPKLEPIQQVPIILGITQQGKPITLYKCIISSWTYPLGGLGGGKYFAHFIFEGVHFEAEEKIRFNQLRGSYTDLDAWVDIYGFAIEKDITDGKFISNIRYEKPAPQFVDVGDTFEVGIDFSRSGPNHTIIQTEVTISQSAYLVVKSKNGDIQFDDLLKQLNIFTDLLQFAIQRIPYPVSVFGFSKENSQELGEGKINIFYQPIEPIVSQKQKLPQEFLFTFKDLSVDQISKWFTSFDKYKTLIHLYRSVFYSNRLFIDTKFLQIAQALESLHSISFDSKKLPHYKFVENKKRVLKTAPNNLKNFVKEAFSNANYKSFCNKIFELLDKKKAIAGRFIDDMKYFAKRVTDTRNEFVHHNKKESTFSNEELPSVIYILTMVFELYLLGSLDFSDEKVKELLESKIQSHLTGWKHLRTSIK